MRRREILGSVKLMSLKKVSYAHQGCIYLIKNTEMFSFVIYLKI